MQCLSEASPSRHKFLARLQGEITKRGVVPLLRGALTTSATTSICTTRPRSTATRRPPNCSQRTGSSSLARRITVPSTEAMLPIKAESIDRLVDERSMDTWRGRSA